MTPKSHSVTVMSFLLLEYHWKSIHYSKINHEQFDFYNNLISREATKWIVNQALFLLINNHFENWLKFAEKEKFKSNGKIYLYNSFPEKYQELPYYIIKIPNELNINNQGIEFHWWTNRSLGKLNNYKCPYNSIKKRRMPN